MYKYSQSHRFQLWGTLFNPVEGVRALFGEIRVGDHGRAALLASLSCGSAKPQLKEAIVGGEGSRLQSTPEKVPCWPSLPLKPSGEVQGWQEQELWGGGGAAPCKS